MKWSGREQKMILKKRKTFEIQKNGKEEKENEPRVLSWMVDYNALYGLLIFIFFVDLRIVIDYLCKKIVKCYSFDWSVIFFSPVSEKDTGKEENEVEENRKGSWKVCLLLWNSLFF